MMPSSALQNYHCHYSFFFAFQLKTAFSSLEPRGRPGAGAAPRPPGGMMPHGSLPARPQPEPGRGRSSRGTPTRPRLRTPAGEQVTGRWPTGGGPRAVAHGPWPTGGPSPPALSEPGWPAPSRPAARRPSAIPCGFLGGWRRPFREQGFQIQVSFSPEACARDLRYPCEQRRKTKTQQSLSQMPVLLNIRRLLNSLDVRVSPTKQPF